MFGVQTLLSTFVLAAASAPVPHDATLLFVTTPGCAPCRQIAPLVREIEAEGFPVLVVDASERPEIVQRLQVDRFPTFLMLSQGRVVDRVVGGGDPIILKPRILKMFQRADELRRKGAAASTPPTSAPVPRPEASGAVTPSFPPPRSPVALPATPEPKVAAPSATIFPPILPSASTPASVSSVVPVSLSVPHGSNEVPTRLTDERSPWIASSVKLRVDAENAHSWGTGTIVDTRNGEALILTCGHIFRDCQGRGNIEVHLFGENSSVKIFGRCLYYDLEIDLALIAIAPPCPVRAVPIAPEGYPISPRQQVVSVGCDNGSHPTIRRHHIISTDRIGTPRTNAEPFHYVQVHGAPVSGRSGGGLFVDEGYLIGVCNTADPVENDGHFVPPHVIRRVLDRKGLTVVYKNPSLIDGSPVSRRDSIPADVHGEQVASMPPPIPARPLAPLRNEAAPDRTPEPLSAGLPDPRNAAATGMGSLNAVEQATLDEIRRRSQDGDEVILIVRSRRNPEIPSEVIILNGTSDQFLDALTNHRAVSDTALAYDSVIFSSHETPPAAMRPANEASPVSGPRTVSLPVLHSSGLR